MPLYLKTSTATNSWRKAVGIYLKTSTATNSWRKAIRGYIKTDAGWRLIFGQALPNVKIDNPPLLYLVDPSGFADPNIGAYNTYKMYLTRGKWNDDPVTFNMKIQRSTSPIFTSVVNLINETKTYTSYKDFDFEYQVPLNTANRPSFTNALIRAGNYYRGLITATNLSGIANDYPTPVVKPRIDAQLSIIQNLGGTIGTNITANGGTFSWIYSGYESIVAADVFSQTISFYPEGNTAVAPIYSQSVSPGTSTTAAPNTTVVISNTALLENTTYTVIVSAVMNDLWKTESALLQTTASDSGDFTTAADKPSTPVITSATDVGTNRPYNNGAVSLAWTQPSGGSVATGYKIEYSIGPDHIAYIVLNANTGSTSTLGTFTGLDANKNYKFYVTALSSGQNSDRSNASVSVLITTVPNVPRLVGASAGDARATVFWELPTADGGKSILDYRATSIPGGITGTANALEVIVTGLTNSIPYTFTVAARNANGYSAESSTSNSVTPVATPTITNIIVSDTTLFPTAIPSGNILVSNSPPSNSGSVSWTNGSNTSFANLFSVSGSGSGGAGTDPTSSTTTGSFTVISTGTANVSIRAINNTKTVGVTWSQTNAQSYRIQYTIAGAGVQNPINNNSSLSNPSVQLFSDSVARLVTVNSITVYSGLNQNGVAVILVPPTASNSAQGANKTTNSTGSGSVTYTAPPTTPTITYSSVTSNSFTVSWSSSGATSYNVQVYESISGNTVITLNGTTTTSFNASGLQPSRSYSTTVTAINAVGTAANTVSQTTLAPPVVIPTITMGANSGVTQTTGTINWTSTNQSSFSSTGTFNGTGTTGTSISKTALTAGTNYTGTVTVTSSTGNTASANYSLTTSVAQYTVTWNANGGSVSPSSNTVNAGGSVIAPTPTRSGFNFVRWTDTPSGDYTYTVLNGGSFTPPSSITMYARWIAVVNAPTNASTPTLSPTSIAVGTTLTAGVGTWNNSPTSYDIRIYRGTQFVSTGETLVAIGSSTSLTYTVTQADYNSGQLYFRTYVNASNSGGSSGFVAGQERGPTANAVVVQNPSITSGPTISYGSGNNFTLSATASNATNIEFQVQFANTSGGTVQNTQTYFIGASIGTTTTGAQQYPWARTRARANNSNSGLSSAFTAYTGWA